MTKAYILQSGFVTTLVTELNKVKEPETSFRERLHATNLQMQDTAHFYEEGVEALFQRYRKNPDIFKEFEFREAVLKKAISLFEGKTVQDWVRFQLGQRTVTFLHRRFLEDTLSYILRSTARKMEPYQYFRLLRANNSIPYASKDSITIDQEIQSLIELCGDLNSTTEQLMLKWSRNYAAMSDMLASLHVIYGLRQTNLSGHGGH
jgi:hypothetical protein